MSNYKIGDKVVIRKDLKIGEKYKGFAWTSNMDHFKEKSYVVINEVYGNGKYAIDDNWGVTDEMIFGLYD